MYSENYNFMLYCLLVDYNFKDVFICNLLNIPLHILYRDGLYKSVMNSHVVVDSELINDIIHYADDLNNINEKIGVIL